MKQMKQEIRAIKVEERLERCGNCGGETQDDVCVDDVGCGYDNVVGAFNGGGNESTYVNRLDLATYLMEQANKEGFASEARAALLEVITRLSDVKYTRP
jgi:hypothetical protein